MIVNLLHLARNLRRSPASAAAAVLTLSLTLGAAASIFAVVHAVLLTPPPFTAPQALVVAGETPIDEPSGARRAVSYATFERWRERAGRMGALEAFDGTNLTLTGLGVAERLSVNDVTPGFLRLLGTTPARGRGFEADDAGRRVAVVSHAFWRGQLGGDPKVIGRDVVLGGQPHTIVGVLPERFHFALSPADLWRPLAFQPAQVPGGYRVAVLARLAPNVSLTSLRAALDDVTRAATPATRTVAVPLATAISGDASKTLFLLAGAGILALLIAFANLAGLLIVRSIDRRRELAIRSALGAHRSETAKQLLLEAQALVVLGTAGGVLLALWTTPVVGHLALDHFGLGHREVAIRWPVMVAVAVAASVCACACALLPVLSTARSSMLAVLRRGATPPPGELRLRRLLVAGEVALAFVLVACVTLLGGSLSRSVRINPGFDADGVLALQVSVPKASYAGERVASFHSALQHAIEERLGSRSAAIANEIPLTGDGGRSLVSTRPSAAGSDVVLREAGPAYFDVMRIPLVAGRGFAPHDDASAPPRVVISASLAQRLFGLEQAIGRRVWVAARAQFAEVVGIVGDVKHRALDETLVPTAYLSILQSPSHSSIVVVRSAWPDAEAIAVVREEVARLDGNFPVYRVRSMRDVVAGSPGMAARRVLTATFAGFAVLALVLGAIGLYGVVAHDVASRRAELALRMALGAGPVRILGATIGQGAVMVGSGLALGGLLSTWAARAISSAGVATDALSALSLGVPAATILLAGAAAVLPAASRAIRADPLTALRSE